MALHTIVAQISAGDPISPDGEASGTPARNESLNNRGYLRRSAWGTLDWIGQFSVDAGGTNAAFAVRVGIIVGATLCDGDGITTGTWRSYFTTAEKQLALADVEGAPASLANSTRYYAFAYNDGTTTLRWQLSTTPPTEPGAPTICTGFKRGQAANYKYLGTFVTDSAGAPVACRASRGRYVYRLSASTTQARALNTSALVGANTDLSLAPLVPPHARLARLFVNVAAGGGQPATFSLYVKPDTVSVQHLVQPPDGVIHTALVDIETDASQVVQYRLTSGGGGGTANALVYVAGFQE